MPSFDVVSEVDRQELRNAIDQAQRELANRYDFKDTNSEIEQKDLVLTLRTESVRQVVTIKVGVPADKAREINKLIKEKGPKGVSGQTQGEQLRVSGKKRDDLQETIAMLRTANLDLPLQFINFRD
jgi:uncharacterized protein YajQ (UPF0234 family)